MSCPLLIAMGLHLEVRIYTNVYRISKIFYPKIAPSRGYLLVGKRPILTYFEDWLISYFFYEFQLIQTTFISIASLQTPLLKW